MMKSMNLPVEQLLSAVQAPVNGKKGKNLIKRLALMSVFVVSFFLSQAQVVEQKAMMAAMTDPNEVARLESLISDLQPAVYISTTDINVYGESAPVCAEVDLTALSRLAESNGAFAGIELLTVRVKKNSDLGVVVDLSKLTAFTNLKYVQIICEIECNPSQVANMVKNGGAVKAFYIISIPS